MTAAVNKMASIRLQALVQMQVQVQVQMQAQEPMKRVDWVQEQEQEQLRQ